ncbi:MAG: thermonuclease family protein [Thermodesulfobacteriota bacterium]
MKRYCTPFYLLIVLILLGLSLGGAEVRFVYDGDTVLLDGGKRVRYLGIDAPEMGYDGKGPEFMAEKARAYNAKKVQGKRIQLELDRESHDHYGRLLAYVYPPDGRMLNIELVEKGLARVLAVPPNLRHLDRLIEAQQKAMAGRVGIWRPEVDSGEGPYIGSRKSFRFHRPDCPFGSRIHSKNRVRFDTKRDAFREGYSPCARCRP